MGSGREASGKHPVSDCSTNGKRMLGVGIKLTTPGSFGEFEIGELMEERGTPRASGWRVLRGGVGVVRQGRAGRRRKYRGTMALKRRNRRAKVWQSIRLRL